MNFSNHTCICKEPCTENNVSTFSVYGEKTNYVLLNNSKRKVAKYIVDDCLLKSYTKDEKCDYLFVCNEQQKKLAILVELKGSNILKAIKQIDSTLNLLKRNLETFPIVARIVSTRVKTPFITEKSYKSLYKKLNSNLEIKNSRITDILN